MGVKKSWRGSIRFQCPWHDHSRCLLSRSTHAHREQLLKRLKVDRTESMCMLAHSLYLYIYICIAYICAVHSTPKAAVLIQTRRKYFFFLKKKKGIQITQSTSKHCSTLTSYHQNRSGRKISQIWGVLYSSNLLSVQRTEPVFYLFVYTTCTRGCEPSSSFLMQSPSSIYGDRYRGMSDLSSS